MRPYYPIFLDLSHATCVVVGGGSVAERKARNLLKVGAKVRLISPEVTGGLLKLIEKGKIEATVREYRSGDLEGAALAFAATDNKEVNRLVRDDAALAGVPVNVADDPELCSFVVPSVVQKGPILVALSTSGLLPGLSKRLKEEIAGHIVEDYPAYARHVGRFRRVLMNEVDDARTRQRIMGAVLAAGIAEVAHMSMREMKERFLLSGDAFSIRKTTGRGPGKKAASDTAPQGKRRN